MRTLILVAMLAAASLLAQEKKPDAPRVYQVDFVIRNSNVATPHKVSLLLEDGGGRGPVRSGTRVPITVETADAKSGTGRRTDYIDTGLNLDCRLRSANGILSMTAETELTTLREPEPGLPGTLQAPAFSTVRTMVNTSLRPSQPAVVGRVEDAASKRTVEISATATLVN